MVKAILKFGKIQAKTLGRVWMTVKAYQAGPILIWDEAGTRITGTGSKPYYKDVGSGLAFPRGTRSLTLTGLLKCPE
jgi:hypothetical protein